MPRDMRPVEPGEPDDYYTSDGTPVSGGPSLKVPGDRVPTRADVANFKNLDGKQLYDDYQANIDSKISWTQRRVIKEYTGEHYESMNGFLLGITPDNEAGVLDKAVRCAAGTLDKFEVPQGSILYRSASDKELLNYVSADDFAKYQSYLQDGRAHEVQQLLDARLQGTQTTRKTFISTTINPENPFIENSTVQTKMYVGEGVKGVYVAAEWELSGHPGEMEYLLAPDTKVTVLGVDHVPERQGLMLHVLLGDLPK